MTAVFEYECQRFLEELMDTPIPKEVFKGFPGVGSGEDVEIPISHQLITRLEIACNDGTICPPQDVHHMDLFRLGMKFCKENDLL